MKKISLVLSLAAIFSVELLGAVPPEVKAYLDCEKAKAKCKKERSSLSPLSCGSCTALRNTLLQVLAAKEPADKAQAAAEANQDIRVHFVSPLLSFIRAVTGERNALKVTDLKNRVTKAKNFLINEIISNDTEKDSMKRELGTNGYKQPDQAFRESFSQSYEISKLIKENLTRSGQDSQAFVREIFSELDTAANETKQLLTTPKDTENSIDYDMTFKTYERAEKAKDDRKIKN